MGKVDVYYSVVDAKRFSDFVIREFEKLGLTSELQIANKLDLDPHEVATLVNPEQVEEDSISASTTAILCCAFGITITELLFGRRFTDDGK